MSGHNTRTLTNEEQQGIVANSGRHEWQSGSTNAVGNSADVTMIEAQIPSNIEKYLNLNDLPADLSTRRALISSQAHRQQVVSRIQSIFDPSTADQEAADMLAQNDSFADSQIHTYDQVKLHATVWNRLSVAGANAEGTFTVDSTRHETTPGAPGADNEGWVDEGPVQYQVELHKVGGRWMIVNFATLSLWQG